MERISRPRRITRRHALGLLSTGAGMGLIAAARAAEEVLAAPFQAVRAPSRVTQIPQGAIVRTILKDLPPDGLGNGTILFHEHMSFDNTLYEKMRSPNAPRPNTLYRTGLGDPEPASYLENVELITEEVKASGQDGVSAIVDAGHTDMGTSYASLRRIAQRSGVHIVASGGYFLQATYPPEISTQPEERLVDELVRDAAVERWGALGEIGSGSPAMTADERKVFRVIGKTHLRTGLPIFTHTPHGHCKACAFDQLDILEGMGVSLRNLCIGHLADIPDDPRANTHKAIAKRGAFLGFDTVGHQLAQGDAKKVALIMAVLEAGYEDYVLLSSDFVSERETKFNGGAGYSSVTAVFLPKLRYAGVDDVTLRKITNDNPKRFLAFVPTKT